MTQEQKNLQDEMKELQLKLKLNERTSKNKRRQNMDKTDIRTTGTV